MIALAAHHASHTWVGIVWALKAFGVVFLLVGIFALFGELGRSRPRW